MSLHHLKIYCVTASSQDLPHHCIISRFTASPYHSRFTMSLHHLKIYHITIISRFTASPQDLLHHIISRFTVSLCYCVISLLWYYFPHHVTASSQDLPHHCIISWFTVSLHNLKIYCITVSSQDLPYHHVTASSHYYGIIFSTTSPHHLIIMVWFSPPHQRITMSSHYYDMIFPTASSHYYGIISPTGSSHCYGMIFLTVSPHVFPTTLVRIWLVNATQHISNWLMVPTTANHINNI